MGAVTGAFSYLFNQVATGSDKLKKSIDKLKGKVRPEFKGEMKEAFDQAETELVEAFKEKVVDYLESNYKEEFEFMKSVAETKKFIESIDGSSVLIRKIEIPDLSYENSRTLVSEGNIGRLRIPYAYVKVSSEFLGTGQSYVIFSVHNNQLTVTLDINISAKLNVNGNFLVIPTMNYEL